MNPVLERITRQAVDQPDAIAVRSGCDAFSYAELARAVTQVASRLKRYQVRSVGLYMDNGIEWIVADLACLLIGARVTPLPWFFSRQQLGHACDSSLLDAIVFDTECLEGIAPLDAPAPLFNRCKLQLLVSTYDVAINFPVNGEKFSYTSGTTGQPRGIRLANDFIAHTALTIDRITNDLPIHRHLSLLPYATLLENIAGIYVPLMQGKTIFAEAAKTIGLDSSLRLDPARLAQALGVSRPNSMILTPQLLEVLCHLAEGGAIDSSDFEFIAVGGARVAPALLRRARDAGIPAYEGYGLTEFGSVATLNHPQQDRIGSVGKPLPEVSVEIASDGEIILETRLHKPDPDIGESRTVRVETGDFGRIDEAGYVYVHGRKSNVIVLPTGRNVSPEWIEAELNTIPQIKQSFVYADSAGYLTALIVVVRPAERFNLNLEIHQLNQKLPAYARLASWRQLAEPFTTDNGMLTPNGRLRRQKIQRIISTTQDTGKKPINRTKFQTMENHLC